MKNSKIFSRKHVADEIEAFIRHLIRIKNYSELTAKTYRQTLYEAFEKIEIEISDTQTVWNLMPYRLFIARQNPKTITKKLSAIRSFRTYLQDKGFQIVVSSDETIKTPKTLPKPISFTHIQEALALATFEERVVIVMLFTLGLRISELCDIRLEDIGKEWLRIVGKGKKQRDVPILPLTRTLIEAYKEKNASKVYLFEKNGEKLSQNSLRYLIRKSFSRIGLKVTPHQLRHSFATSLLNKGAPIADVGELLGHASMATTQIYTKLGSSLKQQNYRNTHPLCNGEL